MITARERSVVAASVYDKASAKGDGIIKEALGSETLATRLGVVRDNARQLKFKAESTGVE